MTTFVVLTDAPADGETLETLTPEPLSDAEATKLYTAMLADVCETVQRGEGGVLINHPPAEQSAVENPERELRDVFTDEVPEPGAIRYEPQVGDSYAGRIGNSLTHLIESEGVETVAVLDPTTAMLRREHIGTAMMKLRSSEVVLGPTPDGGVYFAGFDDPVDFEDAYATPALETLTERGLTADHDVDFLSMLPVVKEPTGLKTAVTLIRARLSAGRLVPPRTAARIEEWGLRVDERGDIGRYTET